MINSRLRFTFVGRCRASAGSDFAICTAVARRRCIYPIKDRWEMARSFTISTEIVFSASHALDGYEGDCARVHGHNWTLRVYYEFSRLDERGIAVDYRELRSRVREVILPLLDHRHLNEVPPFDELNPTSENIAAAIFKVLGGKVRFEGGRLKAVELWETPADMVRYHEQ